MSADGTRQAGHPLTNQRHELFAQGLAAGKTADEAYAAAGYKPNRGNASVLKSNQSISDRVAEILGASAKRVEIDQAWVLKQLVDNVERGLQKVPVMEPDGDGGWVESGTWKYEGTVVNKALELIGKHLGMFAEKHEVTGKDGGPLQFATQLSDDQLAAEAARVIASVQGAVKQERPS